MTKDIKIFDPKEFDLNSFEWGAIYWINKIREAVEGFDEGYEIPDEQMLDLLAPFKKAAKVYAEAQGKDKAWVKETVLSVPETLEKAFGALSEEEGVTRERFLKLFTVEAVCALAKGQLKSIRDIEDYYDRKGIYKGKGGYKVGDFVVIEKHLPCGIEDVEQNRDIKQVHAILGDEDRGEVELVFWNAMKTGVMTRKASDCSEPFPSWEAAMEYKWDDVTTPLEDAGQSEESKVYDELYGAILQSMGVTEDSEPEKGSEGFWEEHDRKYHHGHFDPNTQTCSLREQMGALTSKAKVQASPQEAKKGDEIDNLLGEDHDVEIEESEHLEKKVVQEKPKSDKSRGISRIFTGTAADYSKPSLLKVGTGEGTQVYGHGLYGSSLRNDAEYYAAKAQGNFVPRPGERGDQVIYEQTFFTNRDAGDESHLLSWYDPVSDENKQRIDNALEQISGNKMDWSDIHSGEDVYRKLANFASPQEASEFLANNADIDGIKYPAEDHHGRQVGKTKGWDYVSFRDDNIRIDKKYVNGQKIYDYGELMKSKFPELDAIEVLRRISKMGTPEKMAEEFRRILGSGKVAEDSLNEVVAAAIEAAFGIGEDALDPSDPDFWMKHDRAHHHGHFDPNTQTCKLREEAKAQEVKREQIDMQIDDLRGETPSVKPAPSKLQANIKELSGFLATKGLGEDTIKSAKIIASLPTASQIVKVAQKIKKTSTPRVRKVAAGEFYKTINDAVSKRPESDRWRVDVHPIEDYEKYKCFVSEGGSVFALNGEEIVSVCKNPNDNGISGKSLLAAAVEEGGRKLDSYEGNHAFYAKCGFEPVSWTKFNPEYAPKGALPEDIIFYKYTGHKRILDKAGVEKEIIDFKQSIDAMEYDDAGEYRDTQMG